LKLSVVVVVYNIPREAPRTLFALSPVYQQNIMADDYEIIVVENGSTKRLEPSQITQLGKNFRYYYLENALPSPASAINFGMQRARGEIIGVMIDGARICTPGLLRHAVAGTNMYDRAIVASLGYYLGNGYQRYSIMGGYNEHEEDRLLEKIGWPQDGYRLFEVGSLDESSHWTVLPAESNALFMRKELWMELGGIDERFDSPGGGLVNLDTFRRACELPNSELVIILGEGTFHQIHNGVATNTPPDLHEQNVIQWRKQYLEIRGKEYVPPEKPRNFAGSFTAPFFSHLSYELSEPLRRELSEANSRLDTQHATIARLEAQLSSLQPEIDRLKSEYGYLKSDRDRLQTRIDNLLNSRSWWITKPLRATARLFTALRNGILRLT
jgi:glycosyltransferase involved in cell wall biosynthesis